jgi:hypothetical protein
MYKDFARKNTPIIMIDLELVKQTPLDAKKCTSPNPNYRSQPYVQNVIHGSYDHPDIIRTARGEGRQREEHVFRYESEINRLEEEEQVNKTNKADEEKKLFLQQVFNLEQIFNQPHINLMVFNSLAHLSKNKKGEIYLRADSSIPQNPDKFFPTVASMHGHIDWKINMEMVQNTRGLVLYMFSGWGGVGGMEYQMGIIHITGLDQEEAIKFERRRQTLHGADMVLDVLHGQELKENVEHAKEEIRKQVNQRLQDQIIESKFPREPMLNIFNPDINQYSLWNFKFMTYNLGLRVQQNKLTSPELASEQEQVRMCRAKYQTTRGWSRKYKNRLSQCTENAAGLVADLKIDIVGIQEADEFTMPVFVQHMQSLKDMKTTEYVLLQTGPVATIYNKTRTGPGTLFYARQNTHPSALIRAIQCIYFQKTGMVFINMWFGHNTADDIDKLEDTLGPSISEAFIHTCGFNSPITRIVIAGDTNDDQGFFSHNSEYGISLLGKKGSLHVPTNNSRNTSMQEDDEPEEKKDSAQKLRSCCTDSDFRYTGDYIFDSLSSTPAFFGVVRTSDGLETYRSDHRPVALFD